MQKLLSQGNTASTASQLRVPTQQGRGEDAATPSVVQDSQVEVLDNSWPDSTLPAQQTAQPASALPFNLLRRLSLIRTPSGKPYAAIHEPGHNPYALAIGSKKLNAIIAELSRKDGVPLTKKALDQLNYTIESHAEMYGEIREVWLRVASIEGGIEIDLGDDQHTHVRITADSVEVIKTGSPALFFRSGNFRSMALPASQGDRKLLRQYLNVHAEDFVLVLAWITFVIAHPKIPTSKYPIMVIQAGEGSGKSTFSKVLIRVIDPSALGVQVFPGNAKDLAIAGQHSHLLCYDNLRSFKPSMADMLCIASTGGTIATRQLYTDTDQQAISLHVAMVLNGIHNFVNQPDLAQRCLPIHLMPIDPRQRKPETVLFAELENDLPAIMRGIFDLIAGIFHHLPNVEITQPERMIDFVAWLAAMEKVDQTPDGIYQALYSDTLRQGQLDTLMDNSLAAAIIKFADHLDKPVWSGTPSELLSELDRRTDRGTQYSREWPQNPIALSKRIAGLQTGLRSQGIRIDLSRGKNRVVTIAKEGVQT